MFHQADVISLRLPVFMAENRKVNFTLSKEEKNKLQRKFLFGIWCLESGIYPLPNWNLVLVFWNFSWDWNLVLVFWNFSWDWNLVLVIWNFFGPNYPLPKRRDHFFLLKTDNRKPTTEDQFATSLINLILYKRSSSSS